MTNRSIHRLFPIQDDETWSYYTRQRDCFWVAAELDLGHESKSMELLKDTEQRVLLHILAFFASSDALVTESLVLSLYEDAPNQEARMFYSMQMAIEAVHTETYNLLLDTLVKNDEQKDVLFDAAVQMPSVATKAKWFNENAVGSYPKRLFVQAIVEGIHFSASFAFIFWIKNRFGGHFNGLTLSNEFIARDEGLHRDFSLMLYRTKTSGLTQGTANALVMDAVDVESQFIVEAFNGNGLLGLSHESLIAYVKYTANHLMITAGHDKIYNVKNQFDWMETISLEGKTNFFEKRVSEYKKPSMEDQIFSTDADF